MHRRQFLKQSSALALASCLPVSAWAGNSSAKLLIVMLRGAMDDASLLVPHGSDDYYRLRPNIAIPRPAKNNKDASLYLDPLFALHPKFLDTLYPLWQNGELMFFPFAGSGDTTRSHFHAQDLFEAGLGGNKINLDNGFLNRLVAITGVPAVSYTSAVTPILKGSIQIANIKAKAQKTSVREEELLTQLYTGKKLENTVTSGYALQHKVLDLADEMDKASKSAGSAKGFEREASTLAGLMKPASGYSVMFAEVGGWDTHINQGASTGTLANNLENLGKGILAFRNGMGAEWNKTAIVLVSEFGRTFKENGNKGSDHGHGSTLTIISGGLKGKRILGEIQVPSEAMLFQKRDYPVLTEFRSILANLFETMYDLNTKQLNTIFPGYVPRNYKLLG